jgi:hypothetical protein
MCRAICAEIRIMSTPPRSRILSVLTAAGRTDEVRAMADSGDHAARRRLDRSRAERAND